MSLKYMYSNLQYLLLVPFLSAVQVVQKGLHQNPVGLGGLVSVLSSSVVANSICCLSVVFYTSLADVITMQNEN